MPFNPFKRSGTKSKFGMKKDETRSLPSVQPEPETRSTTDVDSKKKEEDKKDEVIDSLAGKENESEVKDVVASKPSKGKEVSNNIAKNRTRDGIPNTIGRSYQRLWKEVTDYTFHPTKFGTNATFIPNAMQLQKLLEIAIPLVGRTNWILKQEPTFNPYAVAIGYFYMYYVQILRAKEAASDLVGQEASALSRFKKYNPMESIPIPDFLIPFYESIISTQLDDTKYSWIVPTWGYAKSTTTRGVTVYKDWPYYDAINEMNDTKAADYLRPNIPYMIGNLALFGAREQRTGLYNHMTSDRVFEPISMTTATGTRHTHIRFVNEDVNLTSTNHHTAMLSHCGSTFPFQFWNDNYAEARTELSNSKFYVRNGIDYATTVINNTAAAGTAATHFHNPVTGRELHETPAVGLNKIDQYLFVSKEHNPIWFEYIRDQMTIFAKHFPVGLKTFADVATTGGLESSVVCQLKFDSPLTTAGTDYVYPDRYCSRDDSNIEHNEQLFQDLTGSFATSRNDLEHNERLQALSIAINANPAVAIGTEKVREGKFFDQSLTTDTVVQQSIGELGEDIKGLVPMYLNLRDYVKDDLKLKPE